MTVGVYLRQMSCLPYYYREVLKISTLSDK